MVKILVAEDDRALNASVVSALIKGGYEAKACYDGAEAAEALDGENFDLIISDIMMPNIDGFRLAELVRSRDKKIPILFMTALDGKQHIERGFNLGIDDYVVKPFDTEILMLRVGALLRRANIEKSRELTAGNLTMNLDEHAAYLNGSELPLSVREFDILFKLLSNPKRAYTRAQLMEQFWGFDTSATSRTVDVYMAKVREKTAECDGFEILTVHGLGYKAVLK